MTELVARNITVRVGESTLVDDASLSVKTGEFVAILGPNGAGKTTLLRTMLGLADAVSGSSELDGDDCATLPPVERARRVSRRRLRIPAQ